MGRQARLYDNPLRIVDQQAATHGIPVVHTRPLYARPAPTETLVRLADGRTYTRSVYDSWQTIWTDFHRGNPRVDFSHVQALAAKIDSLQQAETGADHRNAPMMVAGAHGRQYSEPFVAKYRAAMGDFQRQHGLAMDTMHSLSNRLETLHAQHRRPEIVHRAPDKKARSASKAERLYSRSPRTAVDPDAPTSHFPHPRGK